MALLLAPYNEAMRIGMGFNSYTQQLCVNDIVRKPGGVKASEDDLRAASRPVGKITTGSSQNDAKILSQRSGTTVRKRKDGQSIVSQVVSWEAGFVDRVSEVTDSLNISGSLAISVDALGGGAGGGGNYLNSTALQKSDATYKVTVNVTNQKLIADDVTEFSPIPNVPASEFNEVYGDTFISGFIEGGVFNALVMKELENTTVKKKMGGKLSVKLDLAGVAKVEGKAKGDKTDNSVNDRHSTTIHVSWSGGGDIKPDTVTEWDIPNLVKVAMEFPDCVAECPQRTYAILTKYSSLRSFREQAVKGSPLDYENAGIYTSTLLDAYMDYKTMWKDLQQMTTDIEQGLVKIEARKSNENLTTYAQRFQTDYNDRLAQYEGAEQKSLELTARGQTHAVLEKPLPPNALEPYNADIFGLESAKAGCRFEMIKIVREVNEVAENPKIATDPYRLRRYLSPNIFRLIIPTSTRTETQKTIKEIEELKKETEDEILGEANKAEIRRIESENEQLKEQISQQQEETATAAADNSQQKAREAAEAKAEELELEISTLRRRLDQKEADYTNLEKIHEDTRTNLSSTISDLDHFRNEIQLLQHQALCPGRPSSWRTDRVQMYFILYGGEFIWDEDAARRMIRFCETNEEFKFNDPIFGRDPRPGVQKSGAILYRYDYTGELRCLVKKQHEDARFDPLP